MMVDGSSRDDEPLRDLAVSESLGDEAEHLELARRQVGGVASRCGSGAARQPAHAEVTQPSRHDRGRRSRVEALQLLQGPS